MILTFVSTKILIVIKNQSNMRKFICIFQRKQVSASALITSDNWINWEMRIRYIVSYHKEIHI